MNDIEVRFRQSQFGNDWYVDGYIGKDLVSSVLCFTWRGAKWQMRKTRR